MRTFGKKNVNEILRGNLTKELFIEVEETFNMVADSEGIMPLIKLPLALKALGMTATETEVEAVNISHEGLDLDKFIEVIIICGKEPAWAVNEMLESFAVFDKDGTGHIEPSDLRRVFARIGESLTETELEDQLKEANIDGDFKIVVGQFFQLVASAKGSEFIFDDAIW